MQDKELLELCLSITGAFEGGAPSYQTLTGNFDGQGLSAGILQWNAGTGSLQTLLQLIGSKMGWDRAQTFFKSDIHHLAVLTPKDAIQFCLDHYIADGTTKIDPTASIAWKTFLSQPEAIEAQIELATNTVLTRARALAATFVPNSSESTRVLAFFFDLVTQSGGMQNARGKVPVADPANLDYQSAIELAHSSNSRCAAIWELVVQDDPLAQLLLHYAYARAQLSRPEYVWDACSRRGAIACRRGIVHGVLLDFSTKLD